MLPNKTCFSFGLNVSEDRNQFDLGLHRLSKAFKTYMTIAVNDDLRVKRCMHFFL